MKKETKKYNNPNYDRRESPFIIRLEAAVIRDGFEDVKSFVEFYIRKGYSIRGVHSLQSVVKERYNLKVQWITIYRNLRKFVPSTYNKKTRGHYKRRRIVKSRGENSVTYFINSLIRKGYDHNDFARVFNIRKDCIVHRLESMYPVKLDGSEIFPEKKLLRVESTRRYCSWLKLANELGFDSVVDALIYLREEKKTPMKDIAWIFKVTTATIDKKIKICKEIKNKQKEKGE